jgi:Pectate lyase superfamily protein
MAVVDVKTFGAVGDGEHDDFPAFTDALTALDSLVLPHFPRHLESGGVLFIPTGEYLLTQPLIVRKATILQGAGSQASMLSFRGPDLAGNLTISGIFYHGECGGIRDLTIWTGGQEFGATLPNIPPDVSDDDPFVGDTPYPITGVGVSSVGNTEQFFEVENDHSSEIPAGGFLIVESTRESSTPNTGTYTVSKSLYDGAKNVTRIVVVEMIKNATAAGVLTPVGKSTNGLALASGIVVRAPGVSVEGCQILGFQHDGIHIQKGNVYNWHVRNCDIGSNGRHGMFVFAQDGCALRVHCIANRKYGFYAAGHECTYLACTTQSNGSTGTPEGPGAKASPPFGGQYWMGPFANVLLGPHDDGGDSVVHYNTAVIGGRISKLSLKPGNTHPAILDGAGGAGDFTAPGIRSSGVRTIAGDYSLTRNDTVILADSSNNNPLFVTLPDPRDPDVYPHLLGYQVTVKKINAAGGAVTLRPPTPPTSPPPKIDAEAEVTLTLQYSWITVVWGPDDNELLPQTSIQQGSWHIIGRS